MVRSSAGAVTAGVTSLAAPGYLVEIDAVAVVA
jgi:enamine deaminase RidA (YjgF/YER057c/UK114 family)